VTARYWRLLARRNWGASTGVGLQRVRFLSGGDADGGEAAAAAEAQAAAQAAACSWFNTADGCVYGSVADGASVGGVPTRAAVAAVAESDARCGWCEPAPLRHCRAPMPCRSVDTR
jgi:hypothetical protein